MLLRKLREYAEERLELPPTLYTLAPVRYVIDLDTSGRLLSSEPVDTADLSDRQTRRGQLHLVPQVQRAVGIKSLLLADNAEYTLGIAREKSRPERVAACHQAYLDLVRRCAESTGNPTVNSVLGFFRRGGAAQVQPPTSFDAGAVITFRVDGDWVVDRPAVRAFWASHNAPEVREGSKTRLMQCVVCGQERPVLDRLQGKIEGVPGGQTSGTAIISANAAAFESYGLEASLVAPTCAECGERFTKALNQLISDRASRLILGGAVFVFWTRRPVDFDFVRFFDNPEPEDVRALLASVWTGQVGDADDTAFYATALSGSGGRTVVRDWIDSTVGEAKRRLAGWFDRQRIVGPWGETPKPLGLYALAAGTVREPRSDLSPPTPRSLLRAALQGTPVPLDLLYQAVRRNRAEQAVTYQRAALIKLVLSRHRGQNGDHVASGTTDEADAGGVAAGGQEDKMVMLDRESRSAAYRCGRLLAVLEEIQRAAMPKVNATIVDRFYGTASAAPASVFARLIRGAQPHLSTLERDRPTIHHAVQARLDDVLAGLGGFPTTLSLTDQGLFALGYYHQRAFDRAEARAASERRRAAVGGKASSDDSPVTGAATDEAIDESGTESETGELGNLGQLEE